mgnify:CR=1 FL=1
MKAASVEKAKKYKPKKTAAEVNDWYVTGRCM